MVKKAPPQAAKPGRPKAAEARSIAFAIRIRPSVKAALAEAALADQRPLSAMAEIAIQEWLKMKGFLK
jgi:hypothetical protein